jgi:hypothetical protein
MPSSINQSHLKSAHMPSLLNRGCTSATTRITQRGRRRWVHRGDIALALGRLPLTLALEPVRLVLAVAVTVTVVAAILGLDFRDKRRQLRTDVRMVR